MSTRTNIMMSGVAAAIVALALIAAVVGSGTLLLISPTNQSREVTITQTLGSATGTLAVLMTDPPTVPYGTTHVYATYSSMRIHLSNAGNSTGWQKINSSGQLDLMSIVNVTQTIALVDIQSGTFNAIEFNITSAIITYEGENYSAYLIYQDHLLFVPIVGGITIVAGQTSAAVIDLTPTVLLLGDPGNASFAFIPEAHAYTVPAQSVPGNQMQRVGETASIANQTLIGNYQPKFMISSVDLNQTSLTITVTNTGNIPLNFRLAAITGTSSLQGGSRLGLPGIASISEFFVVYPNTSLVPIATPNERSILKMVSNAGYILPSHASVTFTYYGAITLGIAQANNQQPVKQLVLGQKYLITVSTINKLARAITISGS